MADFNHGDIVVSNNNNGKYIEAVVDFQQGNNLYISEWGKSLGCPVRYVIPKSMVSKKEGKKIQVSLLEMNDLMYKVLGLKGQDYNKEPSFDNLEVGQQFNHGGRTYIYVGEVNGTPVRDYEGYFVTIEDEDISKLLWKKDDVCKLIFGVTSDCVEVK